MASILTPTQIFKDLAANSKPKIEDINTTIENGILRQEFYIYGKTIGEEVVKIYTLMEKPVDATETNAVIVIGEIQNGVDTKLVRKLASQGYLAISIDLAGKVEGRNLFTIYPSAIDYANVVNSNYNDAVVNTDVLETCWYEWDCNLLYLFKHLKSRSDVKKIGVIGIGEGAVPVWHVIGETEKVAGAVICLNAGWKGYRGHYKNLDNPEPNFTDEQVKYLAGIEPQTYARHLKSPIYLLVATNDDEREVDRAYDSLTRIESRVYSCINYSVGHRSVIAKEDFESVYIFLEKAFSNQGNKKIALMEEITINLEYGETCKFSVNAKSEGLKALELYVANKSTKPSLRTFKKYTESILEKQNKYVFSIPSEKFSGNIVYFAKGIYERDYGVCSLVYYFNVETKNSINKQKVYFSSREENLEKIFYPLVENFEENPSGVQIEKTSKVTLKEGPKGLKGAFCEGGLLTFLINDASSKPSENAMLMIDAFINGGGVLTVSLVADYFGEKVKYSYQTQIVNSLAWKNIRIMQKDFKTLEGMSLKDFNTIEAMEILVDGDKDYAVNNILWV